MKVTVYSTTTCPFCKMLKDYLVEKNIEFEEKFIDQNEAVKAEMEKISGGFLGVPFTVITKKDGKNRTILGFDKGKLDSIFGT